MANRAVLTSLFVLFCCGSLRASVIGLTGARAYLTCDANIYSAGSLPLDQSTLTTSAKLDCDLSGSYEFFDFTVVGTTEEYMGIVQCTVLPCETPEVEVEGEVTLSGTGFISGTYFNGEAVLGYRVGIDQIGSPPEPLTEVPVAAYFIGETQGAAALSAFVIDPSGKETSLPLNTPWSGQARVGRAYVVDETASCSAGFGEPGVSLSCKAVGDPTFEFDQAAFDAEMEAQGLTPFPLSEYYSVEYSPNLAPIPEPSSLLLLGTSLLIFVLLLRRRLGRT